MLKTKKRAFTLIELMISVVIVAILASLGTISYIEQKRKSEHRGMMGAVLSLISAAKNQYYSTALINATSSTTASNNLFGLSIRDGSFYNYSVVPGAMNGLFNVTVQYSRTGAAPSSASYTFNASGTQVACTGADCMWP